ncbi:MAG: hypothetical protein D6719_01550 [Candidatus Dadabacteria bacterium]|nr:MAG: hypothetical protein D6719_01550 [Candidatus Dadabacteria bacterium]
MADNEIDIKIENRERGFEPGEEIRGEVNWFLKKEPEFVDIRLFWHTEGKGTTDSEAVDSKTIKPAGATGSSSFTFRLPDSPNSFSGKLISLIWGIEVVAGSDYSAAEFFTVAPGRKEIELYQERA